MNNPLLDKLAPIVEPLAPGLWPLAYGWWLLIMVSVAVIGYAILSWRKHRQKWQLKRQALLVLAQTRYTSEVNALLKRVAMHYIDKPSIGSMQGAVWSDFLATIIVEKRDTLNAIIDNLYREDTDQDLTEFKAVAHIWISALSKKSIKEMTNA